MHIQEHHMSAASTNPGPQDTPQLPGGSATSFLRPQKAQQHLQRSMDKTIDGATDRVSFAENNPLDKLSVLNRNAPGNNTAVKFAADRLNDMLITARKAPSSSTNYLQLYALAELAKRGGKTAPDSSIKLTGKGLIGGSGVEAEYQSILQELRDHRDATQEKLDNKENYNFTHSEVRSYEQELSRTKRSISAIQEAMRTYRSQNRGSTSRSAGGGSSR